ncbi:LOW QUALITY PROTEIN: RNA polymerase sigma-54 factor RpoN [Bacillus sp. JCM 19045]|nr:LOW QUALITY PROTEIN: RNA polymerase sigma-54 factor RpoN [Bacillus sp. JCM 19045]
MEMGLFQKQTNQLVMTQELRQAIHLLQYSTMDVWSYLEELALENPLLEFVHSKYEQIESELPSSFSSDDKHAALENVSVESKNLRQHVKDQLIHFHLSAEEEHFLVYLANNLREDGYLIDFEELCTQGNLDIDHGERLLYLIQSLEPTGVGARSLGECLALQLVKKIDVHPCAIDLILNDIEDLASRKWKQLAKKYDCTLLDVQTIYDQIKKLDPKPGLAYMSEPIIYIEPDVYITLANNQLQVHLNQAAFPMLRIQAEYRDLLEQEENSREYARQQRNQVNWLKKSLKQREQTILKLLRQLLMFSKTIYLELQGSSKPLTLVDIAEELGIHESTVSRSTVNKYAQTPRGLVELKTFLVAHFQKRMEGLTHHSVKQWISEFIQVENKQKPLSDQQLVEQLKKEKQVTVSRRVIAKYRDELGILSSTKRRRYEERIV